MGQQIELQAADGFKLGGYAAGPADATQALVIVQEIFGVNSHMRAVCDHYAAQGYRVIAPALFDRAERGVALGYDQDGLQHGLALRAKIAEADVLADVEAAATALAAPRTGILGFCWGGTIAWWGATRSKNWCATRSQSFKVAVGWYGGGIVANKDEQPGCPVQLHFGETDQSIPMPDVAAIRAAQPGVEVFTYPGAGHGFGCSDRASYDAAATQLAEQRTLAFLRAHL